MNSDTRMGADQYFMNIALAVRERANCKGSRVGAIIVLDGRIVSTGYNGTPHGLKNCLEGGCLRCSNREQYPAGSAYDLCICVHAEQNALLAAARFGISVEGGTIYTTMQPCFGCMKEMLQAKIKKVYYLHQWTPSDQVRGEYDRLQAAFPAGVVQLEIADHRKEWALSSRRSAGVVDETGHIDL